MGTPKRRYKIKIDAKLDIKALMKFLAETEHQVVEHLSEHLKELPKQDQRSRAILEQMRIDEAKHATTALDHGGAELPEPVKGLMALMSKVMTRTTYRL